MADEDQPRRPPPLPPSMGGKPPLPLPPAGAASKPPLSQGLPLPPGFPLGGFPAAAKPGLPPPPMAPSRSAFPGTVAPALPGFPAGPMPPFGAPAAPEPLKDEKAEMEKKLVQLEKRLAEEREKLLVANIKREEEAATAARVEVSIKELQDKLRRDRRDQEQEEQRLKMEAKLREVEERLAQERETWVTTLKNQLQSRDTQDKEIETHFAMRAQEMERRWLEEKAQWQKVVLGKDEEIRNLRSLAEKLKGADVELSKLISEKKWLESRVHELTQERAEAFAKLQSVGEREKENIQLRADLAAARQQTLVVQDRLERDLQALRQSAKEREERLLSDQERLQRDIAAFGERARAETESQVRRVKAEAEAENSKYKEQLERAGSDLQKLRGIAGALERHVAAGRAQIADLQNSRASWEKTQERYKAEFVVLQRKWVEREKEIRMEADSRAAQMLEAEKAKIKILAQDEINQRAAKIAEQLQKDRDIELKRAEAAMRVDVERETLARTRELQADWDKARKMLEAEIERLHQDLFKKETEWSHRYRAKDNEALKNAGGADEFAARLKIEQESRQALEKQKLDLEKALQDARENSERLAADLKENGRRLETSAKERAAGARREEELERLCTAQGAQVQNLQELLDQARGELAREVHLARLYMKEKQQLQGPSAEASKDQA